MCESSDPELPGAAHHAAEQPLLAAPLLLRPRTRPAAPNQVQAGAGEVDLVIRHKPGHRWLLSLEESSSTFHQVFL